MFCPTRFRRRTGPTSSENAPGRLPPWAPGRRCGEPDPAAERAGRARLGDSDRSTGSPAGCDVFLAETPVFEPHQSGPWARPHSDRMVSLSCRRHDGRDNSRTGLWSSWWTMTQRSAIRSNFPWSWRALRCEPSMGAAELLAVTDLPPQGCLVIDYSMPEMNGLESPRATAATAKYPHCHGDPGHDASQPSGSPGCPRRGCSAGREAMPRDRPCRDEPRDARPAARAGMTNPVRGYAVNSSWGGAAADIQSANRGL